MSTWFRWSTWSTFHVHPLSVFKWWGPCSGLPVAKVGQPWESKRSWGSWVIRKQIKQTPKREGSGGQRWAWDGVSMMRYDEDGPQFVASATISWLFMRERPSTTPLTPRRDARKDVVVMFQETLLFYTLQVWDDLRWWHGRSWDLGSTYCWFWRCGFSNLGIVHVGLKLGTPSLVYPHFPTEHLGAKSTIVRHTQKS